MPNVVLELINISKTYPGVKALDHMSIECLAGEVHAILGENGSGKSTLLGIASGTVTPDDGIIKIAGETLAATDPRLARMHGLATVYQDDSLVRELTVAQNLLLASGKVDGLSVSSMNQWAQEWLTKYDLGFSPNTLVSDLTPANRQFLEILKSLTADPAVLLLDEPTSTLDVDGVEKLKNIIRKLTSDGTGIIYVSHRLPEILELADRVTILRDGVGQGTHLVTDDLSEHDLVSLMVGRPIESEYPEKSGIQPETEALSVHGLTGDAFRNVSFTVQKGEIIGFAGAEGNGQREAIRALAGLVQAEGEIFCNGEPMYFSSPADALAGGLIFLSADRSEESIFAELGVRENMTIDKLHKFSRMGLLSEDDLSDASRDLIEEYGVVTATLDQPIKGLSGGNQQKAVLARSFSTGAKVVLIDEPTQGVDAGARHDIYQAIRKETGSGTSCIVNSSDAMELAGLCDRVLVFSRGQVITELTGDNLTEQNIVSSFLLSRDDHSETRAPSRQEGLSRLVSLLVDGSKTWWVPVLFLTFLILAFGGYAYSVNERFLSQLNIRHILLAAAPLSMVAMAQFNVLLVRGFDISVGSMMSLTVVAASFLIGFQMPGGALFLGVLACLAIGLLVGLVNGALIRFGKLSPVIVTIAMLSILQGFALLYRPSPGGLISQEFTELLRYRIGFVPASAFVLLAVAIALDFWLHRSKSGLRVKAVGFREEAAKRMGVRVSFVLLRAYVLSAMLATVAGFFLSSEVAVGHPTIGANYTLSAIAAAVLGGAALTGGRGSYIGALLGGFFLSVTVNVVSLLGFNTAVGIILSGSLTLFAIFLYSGLQPTYDAVKRITHHLARPKLSRKSNRS